MKDVIISMGIGKIMVELRSEEIVLRVCRYRSCIAPGDSEMMSAASFSDRDAFCSPSAAMTFNNQLIVNSI